MGINEYLNKAVMEVETNQRCFHSMLAGYRSPYGSPDGTEHIWTGIIIE